MAYIGSGISKFNTADGLTVSGDADIDGTANLDVVDIDGAVDMASTLQVDGAITSSAGATITTADNNAQLILKSTDADASVGPLLQLHRDSASPADDDAMGTIDFRGENSASEVINYVRINTRSADVTDGTEDAKFDVNTYVGGASVNRFSMTPTETVFNEDSVDVDFRVESDGNANMLFVDGGNNAVGIGAAPNTTFGSLLYTQGTPAANKPIISGYSTGNSNNAGIALFNDSGNRGIWTTGSTMRFTRTYEGNSTADVSIDASGVVMVGKTDAGSDVAGVTIRGNGQASFTKASDGPLVLNRKTNQGYIALFQYNDTSIGQIGVDANDNFYITGQTGDTGGFYFNDAALSPAYQGAERDNFYDLGKSGARFDDIFATNATIQTSDQNEKQQIASLTTAEITAAKAISALFKTFKWKDKVESKGDAARTHSGVIAQEVQTAMTNAGLDATDYAFWCSDTWWETSTDVPAVEAVDEVTDEDGNVTTEAVGAKDAYTRIDTYYKADEAPDGATQITRMGIRYPELLAFVGAATEQRLANIETRLTALEAE